MVRRLGQEYASIFGAPVLRRVDDGIFLLRYFARCLGCGFCEDACCAHGVDVDEPTVARILERAAALERATGVGRDAWFEPGFVEDVEHPGGRYTRTRVVGGRCVFHASGRRGCLLHAHALESGTDYHELKPMVSALFPLTFDDGLLHPSTEAADGTLVCVAQGPTLYRGARDELGHYFGGALVRELDARELELASR